MSIWIWAGFVLFVLVMLALDLYVINRKPHAIRTAEALRWTGVTIVLALGFAAVVHYLYLHGYQTDPLEVMDSTAEATDLSRVAWRATVEYLTGWVLEYSLSLDNIFVILLIFRYFRVPQEHQHRVLFWGILGALVMRGVMIGGVSELIKHFEWILYLFGGFLIYTSVKLLFTKEEGVEPEKNIFVRLARRLLPVTKSYHGARFFVRAGAESDAGPDSAARESGAGSMEAKPARGVRVTPVRLAMTPLFIVLLVVETTDVVFAVDSIPAIFGITRDPFLVFTSNVFAILGLRSLYFALAAVMDHFRYLKTSLVFVLGFIGVKMVLETYSHGGSADGERERLIPTTVSLAIILGILAAGAIASMFASKRERARVREQAPVEDIGEAAVLAYRNGRKVVVLVFGVTLLALSIPIGLLPGPGGIAVALGGLALLATEFIWARRLLKNLKVRTQSFAARADAMISRHPRPWLIPIVLAAFGGAVWLGSYYAPYGPFHVADWIGKIGPFREKHVLFAAAGPAIAIAYWCVMTMVRWRQQRTRRNGADAAPVRVGSGVGQARASDARPEA
ncbi:MAG: TerC/Alx family metal homeostasis membrane protein [Phycisphaerales bacterium]